jgi:hypothetical protein
MSDNTTALSKSINLKWFSYRFAEQVLNSNLLIKNEIESVLLDQPIDMAALSRPRFNAVLQERFVSRGWTSQPQVFDEPDEPGAKMDFLKGRVGIEVGFGHASFIGIDMLKFQVSSYSALDKIDVGSLRGDDESFPENHEGRLRPELGGLIDVRESEEVSTVFQECDSGSNIRHWNRPLAVGTPTPPPPAGAPAQALSAQRLASQPFNSIRFCNRAMWGSLLPSRKSTAWRSAPLAYAAR